MRLKLIEAELGRSELLELMGACDVFLSLHRSEGFGRGIAEAGILGLQVVCSTWGGNADFSKGEPFHPVPCTPIPIAPGCYAHAENHWWGDPDLSVAAKLLKRVVAGQATTGRSNPNLDALSAAASVQRYRIYLECQTDSNAERSIPVRHIHP